MIVEVQHRGSCISTHSWFNRYVEIVSEPDNEIIAFMLILWSGLRLGPLHLPSIRPHLVDGSHKCQLFRDRGARGMHTYQFLLLVRPRPVFLYLHRPSALLQS